MHGRTRRSVQELDRAADAAGVAHAPSSLLSHLQRSVGNRAVARQLTHASLQRNGESQEVLKTLATPQVREGPAIEVQKNLVTGLEANLAAVIKSDAEKKRAYETKMAEHQQAYKVWAEDWGGFGWRWVRGAEPKLPPAPFGEGRRLQVTEKDALEFNLGGILIDSLPAYKKKDYEGFFKGLAGAARLIPLDSRVTGARSSGTSVPELVDGLAPLVIENTLRTMIDASQFKYLRAAGLPNAQWKILVEVHYIRARPKDMAGFHKDTQGQTLFVNLNYHAGEHSLRGPEYVLNPPRSAKHDERIFGTGGKPATLPKQFTDDLTYARGQLGDPTEGKARRDHPRQREGGRRGLFGHRRGRGREVDRVVEDDHQPREGREVHATALRADDGGRRVRSHARGRRRAGERRAPARWRGRLVRGEHPERRPFPAPTDRQAAARSPGEQPGPVEDVAEAAPRRRAAEVPPHLGSRGARSDGRRAAEPALRAS